MLTKLIAITSLGLCFFAPGGLLASAQVEMPLKAWVQVELGTEGMVLLKPVCKAKQPTVIEYYLTAAKQGQGGNSLSKQSGRVRLKPTAKVTLCTLALNLGPKDLCRVELQIYQDGKLVTKEGLWVDAQGRRDSI